MAIFPMCQQHFYRYILYYICAHTHLSAVVHFLNAPKCLVVKTEEDNNYY